MNIDEIITLLKEFDDSSASEFRYRQGDESIEFRKPTATQFVGVSAAPVAPLAQPAAPAPVASPQSAPQETSSKDTETINSPIVGTIYRAPAPDAPAFIEEGQVVEAGQTLVIIEAMKAMNELEAEFKLEVVSILVENGAMVEHGTPLLEVRRL